MSAHVTLRRADLDGESQIIGIERTRLQWARTDTIDPKPTWAVAVSSRALKADRSAKAVD
jgi:hypothetical protein